MPHSGAAKHHGPVEKSSAAMCSTGGRWTSAAPPPPPAAVLVATPAPSATAIAGGREHCRGGGSRGTRKTRETGGRKPGWQRRRNICAASSHRCCCCPVGYKTYRASLRKLARPHGMTYLAVSPQGQCPNTAGTLVPHQHNKRFGTPVVCCCLLLGPSCRHVWSRACQILRYAKCLMNVTIAVP